MKFLLEQLWSNRNRENLYIRHTELLSLSLEKRYSNNEHQSLFSLTGHYWSTSCNLWSAAPRVKNGWPSLQSVLCWCTDWVECDLGRATALRLCARLKSRGVWFGFTLCLIRLFLVYRFFPLCSHPLSWLLSHWSKSHWFAQWYSFVIQVTYQQHDTHDHCFNHQITFFFFISILWLRAMKVHFDPTHLFLFVVWFQPQSKGYSDTSTQECESGYTPLWGSERLPKYPSSPQLSVSYKLQYTFLLATHWSAINRQ